MKHHDDLNKSVGKLMKPNDNMHRIGWENFGELKKNCNDQLEK